MAEASTTEKKAPKTATPKAPKAEAKKSSTKESNLMAVIATGGKQYTVKAGDSLKIEKLIGEHKVGDTISFDSVLLSFDGSDITVGKPFIKGSVVTGILTKIGRNKTIDVIKYKQKSRYFKKYGHRQPYFEVRIDSIK